MNHSKYANYKVWHDEFVVMMVDARNEGKGFDRIAKELTSKGFSVSKKTVSNKYYSMFPDQIGQSPKAPKFNANKQHVKTYPQEDIDFIIQQRSERKSFKEISIMFKAKGIAYGRITVSNLYFKHCPENERVDVVGPRSNWTDEDFEKVRYYRHELGLSFREIAEKMAPRSKTSIISRYYEKWPVEAKKSQYSRSAIRLSVLMREREKNEVLINANKAGQKFPHANVLTLQHWQCRAILDEDPVNPTWCPNRKSELVKSSYCDHHHGIYHEPKPQPKPKQ